MKITFISGVREGEELDLALSLITIGREPDNQIVLPTEGVSRYHGRFRRNGSRWMVEDLGSTNGIALNGVRIEAAMELHDGDVVFIGNQSLRVSDLAAMASPVVFTPLEPETSPATTLDRTVPIAPLPEPVSPSAPEDLREALQEGGLFRPKKDEKKKEAAAETAPASRRGSFHNKLFYTLSFSLVIVALALAFKFLEAKKPQGEPTDPTNAVLDPSRFLLHYEKELVAEDNVFYFQLTVENGQALFLIDDLKSKRHFRHEVKQVGQAALEDIKNALQSSGFFSLAAPPAGNSVNNEQNRRLLVGANGKDYNRVEVVNNFAPKAFEDIEFAINTFADGYGLQTIALTPQQLRKQAEESFEKAEDLFANREASLGNLPKAILRYQVAVRYLEQFSPKPQLWDRARKRLEEAKLIRKQQLEELDRERSRLLSLKEFDLLRQVYVKIMELTDPDSLEYDRARGSLFKLDNYLNQSRKR